MGTAEELGSPGRCRDLRRQGNRPPLWQEKSHRMGRSGVEVREAKGPAGPTFLPQPNILWALAFIPALSWASTQVEARMASPRRNSQR